MCMTCYTGTISNTNERENHGKQNHRADEGSRAGANLGNQHLERKLR